MATGFEALCKNLIGHLILPSSSAKTIDCKCVYKLKLWADRSIDMYKVRLVAKGYDQTIGFDCFQIFSPVVKPTTICIVLNLVVSQHWSLNNLMSKILFCIETPLRKCTWFNLSIFWIKVSLITFANQTRNYMASQSPRPSILSHPGPSILS